MNKTIMQKITPFLWFDNNAEEAAKSYISIFKNSKIIDIAHYGESTRGLRKTRGNGNDRDI